MDKEPQNIGNNIRHWLREGRSGESAINGSRANIPTMPTSVNRKVAVTSQNNLFNGLALL